MTTIWYRDSQRSWDQALSGLPLHDLHEVWEFENTRQGMVQGDIVVVHHSELEAPLRRDFNANELYPEAFVILISGDAEGIRNFGNGDPGRFFRYPAGVPKDDLTKLLGHPVVAGLRKLYDFASRNPDSSISDWGAFFPLTHLVEPLSKIIHDLGNRFAALRVHVSSLRRQKTEVAIGTVWTKALGDDGYLFRERSLGNDNQTLEEFVASIPEKLKEQPDLAGLAQSPKARSSVLRIVDIDEHCKDFRSKLAPIAELRKAVKEQGALPPADDLIKAFEGLLAWADDLDKSLRHLRRLAEGRS